ncbi:hypothetical protein GGR54DRAFT_641672 [Hypoxylon sp. NC1633]|nr:hypothetical protein GGR54DRAFT_641672 [Hypoxylon sp. NC1633]
MTEYKLWTCHHQLSKIIKHILRSGKESSPAETVLKIDSCYEETYSPSDPLLRFQDDRALVYYLYYLYVLIFEVVLSIPHNHDLQDVLVEVLVELRKLPPKHVEIWNVALVTIAIEINETGSPEANERWYGCKHPRVDLPNGFEEEHPPGLRRDCLIRVAAQYILLAGPSIC